MNKKRRSEVESVIKEIYSISSNIESILFDEDSSRDSIPENLMSSESYEKSEECSDSLESAMDSLSDAIDYLNEVIV